MEKNISYNEYLELVKQEVSKRTGKRVQLQKVTKNNGLELDGLTIISEETNVSPTIYLNGYYNEFWVLARVEKYDNWYLVGLPGLKLDGLEVRTS